MDLETLRNINQIIEKDSKDTTYKFALLRSTIESIQERTPYMNIVGDKVELPIGLLVIKWFQYYYPIVDANLPQKNGDDVFGKSLAFRKSFKEVTEYYRQRGGLSAFYNDLMKGAFSDEIKPVVLELYRTLRKTITNMPMKYIGYSIYKEHYMIFSPLQKTVGLTTKNLNATSIISLSGTYTIPYEYYEVFQYLGGFITGTNSILMGWAEFTAKKSSEGLQVEKVLNEMLKSPVQDRNTNLIEKVYVDLLIRNKELECVWSGASIKERRLLNIDHVIPFSIWKNNDLWNLMPAKSTINAKKSDKIPSPELLDKRKDSIISNWQMVRDNYTELFDQEISIQLIGISNEKNWESKAFKSLKEKCSYLINTRGFEAWKL